MEPEYITEIQDKDLKIAFMNIIEVLKKEMNKSLKEIYENTNSGRNEENHLRPESSSGINKRTYTEGDLEMEV